MKTSHQDLLFWGGAVLALSGLALAAAGGWLAYRGMHRAPNFAPRADHIPPADSPTADAFLRTTFDRLAASGRA